MAFEKLVYATEFTVSVLVRYGHNTFCDCSVLELPPAFRADKCVLAAAKGVVCEKVGEVFFGVGDPC